MTTSPQVGALDAPGLWLEDPHHRDFLRADARRQLAFFAASLGEGPGFHTLDATGQPLADTKQQLHTTTRMVHSYGLAHICGYADADRIVDHGIAYLNSHHKDSTHGGYLWALSERDVADDRKLAYGHVFVLLAASTAKLAGHPDADALLSDVAEVLDKRFWEPAARRFADEWNRDWTPFSTYRGMNANMHGVEALLTAYEATGETVFLTRAGHILDFFIGHIAPQHGWRLPEHYTEGWQIDQAYAGDPMFRPAGTTPGHSFELGRLLLQHWDLTGRRDDTAPDRARLLIERALAEAWLPDGGFAYTLDFDGKVAMDNRFWWPVTEAIGAVATLIKLEARPEDELWYRRLWHFAETHFIDKDHGGWYPEIDPQGQVTRTIFNGKPDIYHSLQACLLPLGATQMSHVAGLKTTTTPLLP
ncbi:AGE family epimerase/isomerase [Phaeobacter porticola]|uniref:N-acyl-D-glucosamine 2-epimerase n=1 Tax=Phaeobacter porticola TaxID=1844006 RepID=A0A1L3I4N3_9RHOB|nr:AGE family epimerase/isomerase [Phaeobacter porticola]APG47090.1 N-acyl-D-glucosamine 2-epimerase [Phaeobacter porticola]